MDNLDWYYIFDSDYEITRCGKVRRIYKNGKIHYIKPSLANNGYLHITVNKRKRYSIHRILATLFIPNPDNKPCVDHINRIRTDNRLCNLRWATHQENCYNKIQKGCICRTKDKVKGKMYYGWRVHYYDENSKPVSKRFKKKEDAELWLKQNLKQRIITDP